MENMYYVIGAGILAMLYAFWKTSWINNQDQGNDRMVKIVLHNELIEVNNEIKIDFIIKNPTSPLEILKSPDSRKLGLLLKSIELKDI